MIRRKKPRVDTHALLGDLIARLESSLGVNTEPKAITDRVDAAVADFRRGLLALHAGKQTAAMEILLNEWDRIARRSVRLAAEHGTNAIEVQHVK